MSKVAIVSDIHANLPALEAVIKELEKHKPDVWLCLGDIVGYGPHPNECIDLVRSLNMKSLMGNHDAGVVKQLTERHFRNPNRKLINKTRDLLSPENYLWLSNLEFIIESDEWIAAHASPVQPEKWIYLESAFTIRNILREMKQNICFVGHTHKPGVVSDSIGVNQLKKGHKFLINPGSVGQSRDGDFRASCGLLDLKAMSYQNFRVPFNLDKVLTDLERLGFSRKEAEHLMRA